MEADFSAATNTLRKLENLLRAVQEGSAALDLVAQAQGRVNEINAQLRPLTAEKESLEKQVAALNAGLKAVKTELAQVQSSLADRKLNGGAEINGWLEQKRIDAQAEAARLDDELKTAREQTAEAREELHRLKQTVVGL